MIYGIDISNWQEGLEIQSLPKDVQFVICKVSEGTSFHDWTSTKFIHDTLENGLLMGFYHYALGMNPEMEAEWFVENSREYFHHGIPVLDYEINASYGNLSESEWCEAFMNRVHELTGCWCMLYTYASKLTCFQETWLPARCGLWLAGYPNGYTQFERLFPPYNSNPWPYMPIWQFTSILHIDGWNGNLDGNIAYMNTSDWKNYYGDNMENTEKIAEAVWGYNYENTIRGGNTIYDEIAAIYDMVAEIKKEIENGKY